MSQVFFPSASIPETLEIEVEAASFIRTILWTRFLSNGMNGTGIMKAIHLQCLDRDTYEPGMGSH